LLERVEDALDGVRRNAFAAVADAKAQQGVAHRDAEGDVAVRRELQRVADQVVEHLLDVRRVQLRGRRQDQVEHRLEREAALLGHRLQQVGDVAHGLRDQRGLRVRLDAIELDARQVQQVADRVEHVDALEFDLSLDDGRCGGRAGVNTH
jgi:hypothetical protein